MPKNKKKKETTEMAKLINAIWKNQLKLFQLDVQMENRVCIAEKMFIEELEHKKELLNKLKK